MTAGGIRVAVLTVSDTRTEVTDKGGPLVRELAQEAGMEITASVIVKDEPEAIRSAVAEWMTHEEVDIIITTGGTGIARRDVTIEAVRPMLNKELDGFGELFRFLSYEEIGTRAILSRALGGSIGDKAVFVLPGSPGAVRLAMEKLIIPEAEHITKELTKHRQPRT
nr:molybdenum cofactor biosynthesis protein B [Indiicoccus explosivorum]